MVAENIWSKGVVGMSGTVFIMIVITILVLLFVLISVGPLVFF
jgi:hypothetical protein